MMATKPTTSVRDRKISLSPARTGLKTSPLSHGNSSSPSTPEAKKPMPTITTGATSKTQAGRRLADKAPSTPALQRSLKQATPMPKRSNSSVLHGDKAAQTVSRTAKTSFVRKAKRTSPTLVKKKEAPVSISATSEVRILSDYDSVTAFERPEQQQMLKNVEEIKFVSSLVAEENQIEEEKGGEPENLEEVLVPQVFDEVSKEPVLLEEITEQAGVAVASTPVERRNEEKKIEHVNAVARAVDLEVRKPKLTVVTAMPAMKKKDVHISNDVIQETKSKLMGTRKNKVLALVGAFETVFSLQEHEGQQIQKALQVQHGKQIQQDQQAE